MTVRAARDKRESRRARAVHVALIERASRSNFAFAEPLKNAHHFIVACPLPSVHFVSYPSPPPLPSMFSADSVRESNALGRTSSASSVSSIDTQASDDILRGNETPRRTRKRFTSTQLMALEHLFHQTSHPTREQREALSKEAGM